MEMEGMEWKAQGRRWNYCSQCLTGKRLDLFDGIPKTRLSRLTA